MAGVAYMWYRLCYIIPAMVPCFPSALYRFPIKKNWQRDSVCYTWPARIRARNHIPAFALLIKGFVYSCIHSPT